MKKVIRIVLWSLFGVGLIFVMAFAGRAHRNRICQKLNIQIDRRGTELFIDEDDVVKLLHDHNSDPVGKPVAAIDVPALEKLVMTHAAVQSCDVYGDIDGTVSIHLLQRKPVARMVNLSGESYYFDDRGYVMPATTEYTAPLLLVNGYFGDTYAASYNTDYDNAVKDSVPNTPSRLDDIWQVVKRVEADTFLRAQIVQVYVNADGSMSLVPRIGDQIILIGKAEDLDDKFRKLLIFYREGLARTGKWNDYKTINLEYSNQIVCTKK